MAITRIQALKQFFNQDTSKPVDNTELMAFWKVLTDDERAEYAGAAASQLGVELSA